MIFNLDKSYKTNAHTANSKKVVLRKSKKIKSKKTYLLIRLNGRQLSRTYYLNFAPRKPCNVNQGFLKVNFFELAVYETIFPKRNVNLANTALDYQDFEYHSLKYTNYNIS